MQAFFAAFPRYRRHAFFIAGESYAGVYVPTLAEAILSLVDTGAWKGGELRGIAVGNGCSGTEVGGERCPIAYKSLGHPASDLRMRGGAVCGGQRWVYDTQFLIGTALVDPQLKGKIVAQVSVWTYFNPHLPPPAPPCSSLAALHGSATLPLRHPPPRVQPCSIRCPQPLEMSTSTTSALAARALVLVQIDVPT